MHLHVIMNICIHQLIIKSLTTNFINMYATRSIEFVKVEKLNSINLPGGLITSQEIAKHIRDLKRNKSPRHDEIQNEHLIFGGKSLFNVIAVLINGIVKTGNIPSD